MRRFERSSHSLAPVPTVHAAAAWFCWHPKNQKNSLDDLSRQGLDLRTDHVAFKVEHTGAGWATGGEGSSIPSP